MNHNCFPPPHSPWAMPGPLGQCPFAPWTPAAAPRAEDHPLYKRLEERLSSPPTHRAGAHAPKRTHMIFVLDQSYSMLKGREVTIAGFNDQVAIVREQHAGAGHTTVSLVLFNSHVQTRYAFAPPSHLQGLTVATYRPNGDTALYDAIGQSFELVMQAEGFEDENTAFFVAIFTDGGENASHRVPGDVVAKCIERLEATGRVTVSFMGPQEGLKSVADSLAMAPGNLSGYDATTIVGREHAFNAMSGATSSYMALRSQGISSTKSLYATEPEAKP
jgi:hypothetical protein